MRIDLHKGRYQARLASDAADLLACQRLRQRCFFGGDGVDADHFDPAWSHLMVTDGADGPLVCTLRYNIVQGADVLCGYSAGFYNLSGLAKLRGPLMEIGRFCTHPAHLDPHILRVAWGALTRAVDSQKVQLVFGCTSFAGLNPAPHAGVFQRLARKHTAPDHLGPLALSDDIVGLASVEPGQNAQSPMPPLLRTYLAMGGWVSDHAVRDRHMHTLHVLTGLEIATVPPARADALRALA
jgi:putative hemolysin